MTWRDIIVATLIDLSVISEGEQSSLDPDLFATAVSRLNTMLGDWSNELYLVDSTKTHVFNIDAESKVRPSFTINATDSEADFTIEPPLLIETVNYKKGDWDTPLPVSSASSLTWINDATVLMSCPVTRYYHEKSYPTATVYFDGVLAMDDMFSITGRFALPAVTMDDLDNQTDLPDTYNEALIKNLCLVLADTFGHRLGEQAVAHVAMLKEHLKTRNVGRISKFEPKETTEQPSKDISNAEG